MTQSTRFPSLELSRPPEVVATQDDLASLELKPGFRLPPSYCDFAVHFGYGELCKILIVYIPIPDWGDDLSERHAVLTSVIAEGVAEEYFEYEPDGSPELVNRLVPFGISIDGHILTWDPEDKTARDEYRIYVLGPKLLAVRRAATDLYDFLEKCLDDRVAAMLGSSYEPLHATFAPVSVN